MFQGREQTIGLQVAQRGNEHAGGAIDLFIRMSGGDIARQIRMDEDAAEGAAQLVNVGTEGVTAAFAMRKRHDAIDVGGQRRAAIAARR